MPSYYDIDTILAEEELLTVKPKFAFAHLSHLDPDSHRVASSLNRKRRRSNDGEEDDGLNKPTSGKGGHYSLPEGTKIKMPLWAMDRWAMLNFVKIPTLPRHYRQRMKERLEADPVGMNLSNKNEHYFLAGTLLTNLLLRTAHIHKRNSSTPTSRRTPSRATDAESLAMEQLSLTAKSLQHTLLTSMMGDRLCRNFDWTLSALDAMEDDVSDWIVRLSVLERNMFGRGVEASGAVKTWREFGCGRMG
eukprot:CAMPEP_0172311880 /NCGR_PEP_ID=MMETSP1058-20130122/15910_1 /TAXON_ID=83371 /ORGANISM="Detonula confervacea, Strain CCMP 353" /LENGTH=246 /DNA_ID=CAMNT_0013025187 /DNA_START=75 /DNA_END=811 /DNA_ORIENTATION=-